jgi:hypothetical protein
MKKYLSLAIFVLLCAGCTNDNQIRIENQTLGDVTLNFRAAAYTVPSGKIQDIKNIPNGTYTPNVTYYIPAGLTPSALPTGTSLAFDKNSTHWYLLFASLTQGTTYTLSLNETTSDPVTTSTTTTNTTTP